MRVRGTRVGVRDPGDRGHVCWSYERTAEFLDRARTFLAAGLAANQRVCFIGPGDAAALTDQVRTMPGIDDAFLRGAIGVLSLDEHYPPGTVVDPVEQVAAYAGHTEQALADGFEGFRVAADATQLVREPAALDAFARFEHLVDQYMATHPFSALCAYNRAELGDAVLGQLVSLHPQTNAATPTFRLHAWASGDGAVALDGELDMAAEHLWPLALDRIAPRTVAGRIVFDAGELRFIDHRSLRVLSDYATRNGVTAVLRTPLSGVARLVGMLALDGVCVEPVG